jgi:hypothetical protein
VFYGGLLRLPYMIWPDGSYKSLVNACNDRSQLQWDRVSQRGHDIAPCYSHDLAISACREPVTRSGLALQVEQVLVEYGLPLLAWPILIIQKGLD